MKRYWFLAGIFLASALFAPPANAQSKPPTTGWTLTATSTTPPPVFSESDAAMLSVCESKIRTAVQNNLRADAVIHYETPYGIEVYAIPVMDSSGAQVPLGSIVENCATAAATKAATTALDARWHNYQKSRLKGYAVAVIGCLSIGGCLGYFLANAYKPRITNHAGYAKK